MIVCVVDSVCVVDVPVRVWKCVNCLCDCGVLGIFCVLSLGDKMTQGDVSVSLIERVGDASRIMLYQPNLN